MTIKEQSINNTQLEIIISQLMSKLSTKAEALLEDVTQKQLDVKKRFQNLNDQIEDYRISHLN